jgi:hypothetical protein
MILHLRNTRPCRGFAAAGFFLRGFAPVESIPDSGRSGMSEKM